MVVQRSTPRAELKSSIREESDVPCALREMLLVFLRHDDCTRIIIISNISGGCKSHGFLHCSCLISLALPRYPKSIVASQIRFSPGQGHIQSQGFC